MKRPVWLSQVLVESTMIVLSILLALWVDEWRGERARERLMEQSLSNFAREMRQNRARLDDIIPYHQGLAAMLKEMTAANTIRSRSDFFELVGLEGVRPPFLLDTAWQTALATGALTHMDYQTVSALSLTYTLQSRYREDGRTGLPEAIRTGGFRDAEAGQAARSVALFLDEITRSEQELQTVYEQALGVVEAKLRGARRARGDADADTAAPTPPAPTPP